MQLEEDSEPPFPQRWQETHQGAEGPLREGLFKLVIINMVGGVGLMATQK